MFKFRLQTVLDLRLIALDEAERLYVLAKSKRESAQADHDGVQRILAQAKQQSRTNFQDRIDSLAYTDRLQDESRALLSTIGVLEAEEDQAFAAWMEAKKKVKTIEKLRIKALEEYQLDETRRQQAEIDEWATLRGATGRAA
jgi:flagellar export protein FliJ